MAAHPAGESATRHSFVSVPQLRRVHSAMSSRSLMKMLNSLDPSVTSWDTPLVTVPLGGFCACDHKAQTFQLISIHLTVHLSNPYFVGLSMRILNIATAHHKPMMKSEV